MSFPSVTASRISIDTSTSSECFVSSIVLLLYAARLARREGSPSRAKACCMGQSDSDDIDDGGPRAWSKIDAWTDGDGSIAGRWSTNDNRDTGYPNEFSEQEVHYASLAAFARSAGYSRTGASGVEVTITLDGADFTSERHQHLERTLTQARER